MALPQLHCLHDTLALHQSLESIAACLSLLSDTLTATVEETFALVESRSTCLERPKEEGTLLSSSTYKGVTHLEAPIDVAMVMTTKAKCLFRELKRVRADLAYMRSRCAQLEEENERLRDGPYTSMNHEYDDLVSLQLEALLEEKNRLAQENASYTRENFRLQELVKYHQLSTPEDVNIHENVFDEITMGFDLDEPLQIHRHIHNSI